MNKKLVTTLAVIAGLDVIGVIAVVIHPHDEWNDVRRFLNGYS